MRLAKFVFGLLIATSVQAQPTGSQSSSPHPNLKVTSRAVVVDVIVTDSSGNPVAGLKRDAFKVTDQGHAQTISFFEEHGAVPTAHAVEMPKLPPGVFTNFSPFPQPQVLNVLLLDSLNTPMESHSNVHSQVMQFLGDTKPGTRSAIFTMGLALHFVQGFNDDPAVLMASLKNKKNNEVEPSVMLKGEDEANAQQKLIRMMNVPVDSHGNTAASAGMAGDLQQFMAKQDTSRSVDRMFVTLANLQRLAAFLQGFPGRKNIIWFAAKVPGVFLPGGETGNPAIDDEIEKTLTMLTAARAAIYPVDPGGSDNTDLLNAQLLAEQSGGQAFATITRLSGVIEKITSSSAHFYTLSYTLNDPKMDGRFRKIHVAVSGGNYSLSYRRGYFVLDGTRPGSTMSIGNEKQGAQNTKAVDPLLPLMDLGMPQAQQILYKIRVVPDAAENKVAEKTHANHYKIDFAIDQNDLKLKLHADGLHKGELNVSLIVYDRYGNVVTHEDHLAQLIIKPDVYAIFQNSGVQLHAEVSIPKGNYWLRTGVYDPGSGKVGTMEVALSSVNPSKVSTDPTENWAGGVAQLHREEPGSATLKRTARSVLVDVVVTDDSGMAVEGLQQGDFEIKENGRRQAINFFEPHFLSSSASTEPLTAVTPKMFTNVSGSPLNQSVNVLLMDAQNTQMMDQGYVRMQMVKCLASLSPGIRIGVFALGDRLWKIQGFMEDSSIPLRSIAQLAADPSHSPLLPALEISEEQETDPKQDVNLEISSGHVAESAAALDGFLKQEVSFEPNRQLLVTLDSLQTIAQYLARIPGRKNLIWFLGSFPLCLRDAGEGITHCPLEGEYRKTINALASARVSVYPVDATRVFDERERGRGSRPSAAPSLLAGEAIPKRNSGVVSGTDSPFFGFISDETWAEGTGGNSFHGNRLNEEIARAINDGAAYYTLSYTPTDQKEKGRERKIQISLKHAEYKLSYRRSYYELTPKELRISGEADH
ncbi:VWA domain-containing protein [Occallatibacter riparius]|uniref:VWA domain-containing protein n=1 Tax=Occallatibacter riparius TaxID=1002689 RepID=A0A9J7BU98_9BACT|nr:VWA domain-containing protein [Occallatibacter riparius]UWZ85306.1 VWA domain-containing protein [Occallatibacter riparius]